MELVIHAGIHKTGTTALQRFLDGNRDWLLARGVCYPPVCGFSHAGVAHALAAGDSGPLHEALEQIRASGAPMGLLSSEDFRGHSQQVAKALGDRTRRTRVVIYLRRQDSYLQSVYQEHVKSPRDRYTGTFEAFCAEMGVWGEEVSVHFDWHGLLGRWAAVFPRENIRVRVYEPGQFEGGTIFSDFLGELGLESDGSLVLPEAGRSNESLDFATLEMLRRSNGSRTPEQQALLLAALQEVPRGNKGGRRASEVLMSPGLRRRFLECCDPGNQRVAREWLGRGDGMLFREPWPEADAVFHPPQLTVEDAVPVLMGLLLGEYEELEELRNRARGVRATAEGAPGWEKDLPRIPGAGPWKERFDHWLSRGCPHWDAAHYLGSFPDVRASGIDPLLHFVRHGWREGRNPGPGFDTTGYLRRFPRRMFSGWSPLALEAVGGLRGRIAEYLRRQVDG